MCEILYEFPLFTIFILFNYLISELLLYYLLGTGGFVVLLLFCIVLMQFLIYKRKIQNIRKHIISHSIQGSHIEREETNHHLDNNNDQNIYNEIDEVSSEETEDSIRKYYISANNVLNIESLKENEINDNNYLIPCESPKCEVRFKNEILDNTIAACFTDSFGNCQNDVVSNSDEDIESDDDIIDNKCALNDDGEYLNPYYTLSERRNSQIYGK